MSLHDIVGLLDRSSLNLGSKCRLAKPVTLPNLVMLQPEVCEISTVQNFAPRKGTKIHQNPLRPAMHQCHSLCKNFTTLGQKMYEKGVTKFFPPSVFCQPVGAPGPKFIHVGSDVQQGVDCQCAKFRRLLITCQRHICC